MLTRHLFVNLGIHDHFLVAIMNQSKLDGPALEPPPGTYSMLDNPPNQNALVEAVAILCLTVTTIAFSIHAYSGVFVSKTFRVADCKITEFPIRLSIC
jgi:hypothetical protein